VVDTLPDNFNGSRYISIYNHIEQSSLQRPSKLRTYVWYWTFFKYRFESTKRIHEKRRFYTSSTTGTYPREFALILTNFFCFGASALLVKSTLERIWLMWEKTWLSCKKRWS